MSTPISKPKLPPRGSAAVEFAILFLLYALITFSLLFLTWVFWHYTVATKAAHDGARFLAAATPREMQSSNGGGEIAIAGIARELIRLEIAELSPGAGIGVDVQCYVGTGSPYWSTCYGFERPKRVMVRLTVAISDPLFSRMIQDITGGSMLLLRPVAVMEYAGG